MENSNVEIDSADGAYNIALALFKSERLSIFNVERQTRSIQGSKRKTRGSVVCFDSLCV